MTSVRSASRRATGATTSSPLPSRYVWLALGVQAVIALLVRSSTAAATALALGVIVAAAVIVLNTRRLDLVAAVAGYVAGSEVLWRMTSAGVFWQASEYGVIIVLGLAALRLVPRWRNLALPLVYLIAFVPGVALSWLVLGTSGARDAVSFNVSVPLALATSVLFFSQVRTSLSALRQVLWATMLPIVSVALIATISTASTVAIHFTQESNFAASGGFGPNQVSAALGFGAVAALLLAYTETVPRLRLVEGALALWFLSQAMLTFSRGGVLNVVVALVLVLLVMARDLRSSARHILIAIALAALVAYVLYPRLDQFTGNELSVRYTDTTTTNREAIASGDLSLFGDHPWVGAGIGVSTSERPGSPDSTAGKAVAAHTEYTRLLAEQGLFGIAALAALLGIVLSAFWRSKPPIGRVHVVALATWSLTDMTHAATRLSLVGFAIGLAVAASRLMAEGDLRPQSTPISS